MLFQNGLWYLSTMSKILLTGMTPSGRMHIGNYSSVIKPMLNIQDSCHQEYDKKYIMIADLHSLINVKSPSLRKQYVYDMVATCLALGINPDKSILFLQSAIPEIPEMQWIMSTLVSKNLLERSHAIKDKEEISMGLFNYPILMAADIITLQASSVMVGGDQAQHIEIARNIVDKLNSTYDVSCSLPKGLCQSETIMGLDGRKMSKSYQNTIEIPLGPHAREQELMKIIQRIRTTSQEPEEPKDEKSCTLFALYSVIASETEISALRKGYAEGISWMEVKSLLFEKMESVFAPRREQFDYLTSNTEIIDQYLSSAAKKVREHTSVFLDKIKKSTGLITV